MSLGLQPQTLLYQSTTLEDRIQGTTFSRVLKEFVSTSALFPILDAIRVISNDGLSTYLTEPSHYALLIAAVVQAWYLGRIKQETWQNRFMGNILGFALYVPLDLVLEGMAFFAEPYHWLFGGFSLTIATLSALQATRRHDMVWQTTTTLLLNVAKLLLFPGIYFITEQQIFHLSQLTLGSWQTYMASSGHQFIFYGALFFGILLGLAEAQRNQYARFLRFLAEQLKKYSEWSLGSDLIVGALENPDALDLHRVEKTILFMDIRGFTAWSENADPQTVVEMLTRYYDTSENILAAHHGHKPNFTADEVMTRFASADEALQAAQALQQVLHPLLTTVNLAVGIGLNTGEVIEGLMGSSSTRKYDIIGDAVNTAKRLESAAGPGEIVLSERSYRDLKIPAVTINRTIKAKGKSNLLNIFVISKP